MRCRVELLSSEVPHQRLPSRTEPLDGGVSGLIEATFDWLLSGSLPLARLYIDGGASLRNWRLEWKLIDAEKGEGSPVVSGKISQERKAIKVIQQREDTKGHGRLLIAN